MHIFYSPNIGDDTFFLEEEESKHAVRVLRLKEKDKIIVVDGKGGFYQTEITKADPKKCALNILHSEKSYEKKDYFIHVAIAPTKNIERIEWFLEKSVEIGIDKISFIQCQRSERKTINIERLEKIAINAMKQSLKAYLPQLSEMISFKDFLNSKLEDHKYIGHLEEVEKKDLFKTAPKKGSYCVLIGPEGDFSAEEIEKAKSKEFIPVTLGNSRLRTETAGLVSCHTLNLINN